MNKQTYKIIGSTLAIPNVPGTWHAGQEVDVDTDTNEVLATRLQPTTPHDADTETTSPQTMTVQVSLDDKPIGAWTDSYVDKSPVAVKKTTDITDERNIE